MATNSRNWRELLLVVGASAGCLMATAAGAQDWDTSIDLRHKSIVAYVQFDNGLTLASRCVDGDFEVIVTGLSESPKDDLSRVLSVAVGDEPLAEETWSVGSTGTTAFSRLPAPFARRLAQGGSFQIGVPGRAGQPRTRYVMELSSSSSAVEQTLAACNRPLIDPRDALLPRDASDGLAAAPADLPGIEWAVLPRPQFPMYRASGYASAGSVTLSCEARSDGSIASCVVESEHPPKFDFASESVKAALRARLRLEDGAQGSMEGRVIVYSTTFRLQ